MTAVERTGAPPEPDADSRLAEFTAERCRHIAAALLEHTGPELRARLRDEVSLLDRALTGEAGELPPAVDPPWVNRRGAVDVNTSPVTGRRNPLAPELSESVDDDGALVLTVTGLGRQYQGPRDRVHGGYLGVLLDHALWRAVHLRRGGLSFTRNLSVTYEQAAPIGSELVVSARVDSEDGRRTRASGEVRSGSTVCATAEGLWIAPRPRE